MASILEGARERATFAGEGGRTGASFERAVLADGTSVVIKHVSRTGDWVPVAAGDIYLDKLWDAGVFERVPREIDHTMLAVEPTSDGIIVVMRDVSDAVLEEGRVLSRDENRRVLIALDRMHHEFWNEQVPGLPLYQHYTVFSPTDLQKVEHLATPIPALARRGWEMFDDVAPRELGDVLRGLLAEPAPLVDQMKQRPVTMIHGDLRLHNMGLTDEHVVLLDWEITGNAPPAVEFAWYLIISASRVDASREEVIEDYRDVAGERFDPYAWDLACIGALMWLGWNKALDIVENPNPAIKAAERADLDWWIARVRAALEVWSPK